MWKLEWVTIDDVIATGAIEVVNRLRKHSNENISQALLNREHEITSDTGILWYIISLVPVIGSRNNLHGCHAQCRSSVSAEIKHFEIVLCLKNVVKARQKLFHPPKNANQIHFAVSPLRMSENTLNEANGGRIRRDTRITGDLGFLFPDTRHSPPQSFWHRVACNPPLNPPCGWAACRC